MSSSSPPSSTDSSSSLSSPSPTIDPQQLKADAETFQFLIQSLVGDHTTSTDSTSISSSASSSQANSPPDWSDLSSWTHADAKYPDIASDFNFALPMDLEFDPTSTNMAVDPSALHFTNIFDQQVMTPGPVITSIPPVDINPFVLSQSHDSMLFFPSQGDTLAAAPWPSHSHLQPQTGRRLSITSSSSSSGASLSPIVEHASVSSTSSPSSGESSPPSDPASDLAQRVRQMAGVTLAVPVSAQVQQMAAAGGQNKLPIPRLPRPSVATLNAAAAAAAAGNGALVSMKMNIKASPTSDAATSPSSASSSASPDQAGTSATPPPASSSATSITASSTVIGRPKTSHTTIERRYRTNLNARITGLKQAVPALRVLEAKTGALGHFDDIVDERGFVDGVKVARKMSKANVLGKATEYIR